MGIALGLILATSIPLISQAAVSRHVVSTNTHLAGQIGVAQTQAPLGAPEAPPPARDSAGTGSATPASPSDDDTRERQVRRRFDDGNDVVQIGSSYTLRATDSVGGLVVIMGDATIEGHVGGDLLVVLGELNLGPSAVIDGQVVVVGGNLGVKTGAVTRQDLVVVGGSLDAAPSFRPGGEQFVFGFRALGTGFRSFLPWLTGGLLLGRPIVPSLPWVWGVVGVLFLVYLGVLLVFEKPVRASAEVLAATPLRAVVTGTAVMVLMGPIVLLLAATVVGLLAVPFALCAIVVAGLIGRIAAARWLGTRVVTEEESAGRGAFVRSFVVGSAIVTLAYMVPILGGVVWVLVGAAGLGASVLAFATAYRRENPPTLAVGSGEAGVPVALGALAASSGPDVFVDASDVAAPAPPPVESGASSVTLFPKASFVDRLAAFVLDGILVALVIGVLPSVDDDAFIPLFLAYRFVMWVWKGVTVGGIICQLRIARVDGQLMSGGEALVRSLVSLFSVVVFGIGCLWMLRDPEGQTWHDRVAGTIVVKVPRNWPL